MALDASVSRVIALEEAFLHPRLWELFPAGLQQQYRVMKKRLTDVGPERIELMDAAGIDLQVLSHVQPGIQCLEDPRLAVEVSREINDWLAEVVRKYPDRFAGFAALPTQSPGEAADELERSVTRLGLKGALINGHTHGRYLDDPSFSPLFQRAEALDVPIYIHPTDPPQAITDTYYAGYAPPLVTGWGWPVETGTHLLRIMCAGVFDRHPKLKIILGHMGELIPYCLTRVNLALTFGNWLMAAQEQRDGKRPVGRMQKSVREYMRENVFVTSSGVFDQPALNCAVAMLGIENLLFSVDDPFQDNFEATSFLQAASLSSEDKDKFAHRNAERLLKLPPASGSARASSLARGGSSWRAFKARSRSRLGRALISFLIR